MADTLPNRPKVHLQVRRETLDSREAVEQRLQAFSSDASDGWLCTTDAVRRLQGVVGAGACRGFAPLSAEMTRGSTSLAVRHLGEERWSVVESEEGGDRGPEYWRIDHDFVAIDPALGSPTKAQVARARYCVYWPTQVDIHSAQGVVGPRHARFTGFVSKQEDER